MFQKAFAFCVIITALSAQTVTTIVTFNGANGAGPSGLLQASDGNYYGVTGGGGSGYGTIYRLTPEGVLTTIYSFTALQGIPSVPGQDGATPVGLIQAKDGNFYGLTSTGGAVSGTSIYGGGTVFKLTPTGDLTTLYSFTMSDGYSPTGTLIQGSDGNFYGVTREGGQDGNGSIFRITPSGTLTVLHSFAFDEGAPAGGLVQASDGNFYGAGGGQGEGAKGIIFKLTPSGMFTSLHVFTGSDGVGPVAPLIQASDGNLYGTTSSGGANGDGTFFKITLAGSLTTLHDFSASEGTGGSALLEASDGNFYGMAFGLMAGSGRIFKLSPAGALTTIMTFNRYDGSAAEGPLIQGSDGKIYGAAGGGNYNDGIVLAFPLSNSVKPPDVTTEAASAIMAKSATLYGSVSANGADTEGWFQYSTNSSMSGGISTPHQALGSAPAAVAFQAPVMNLTAGSTYYFQAFASNSAGTSSGSVVSFTTPELLSYTISGAVHLSDGSGLSGIAISLPGSLFYVTTDSAGKYSFITMASGGNYTLTPLATGYTFVPPSVSFTDLSANQTVNFTAVPSEPAPALTTLVNFGDANGSGPEGGLIQTSDGKLYGATGSGGANGLGTVFQLNSSGALTTLHSFSGPDGASPRGPLTQGSNGNLYGTTSRGGTGNEGTVYQITPAGNLTTSFSFSPPGSFNGSGPVGALVQGNDGDLYGTTNGSAAFDPATIFKLTPSGDLATLYTFGGALGSGPANLVQGGDGNLYGGFYGGSGAVGPGFLFKIAPSGGFTALYAFCAATGCADGEYPTGQLVQGYDGDFYGAASNAGSNGAGAIFTMTPDGSLSVVHSFSSTDGAGPNSLVLAPDGNFYGTTARGGAGDSGTIFRMTPDGSLTTLHSFSTWDGASPQGQLLQAADGNLYGTTQEGGVFGQGTVFRLNLGNLQPAVVASSGIVSGASFQPGIAADSWITILGANLSSTTDSWSNAVVNGVLPTSLDGVSVSVGGQPAYIAYVSPTQINALAPDLAPGTVSVVVSNGSATTAAIPVTGETFQPAFFLWGNYVVATHIDYSLAVKNGAFPSVPTVPAKPGDTIILWGTGFGPTAPAAPQGMVVPSETAYNTANAVTVTVGGVGAKVLGAALAPGAAGLYQIAIQIPQGLADGDCPVVATVGGAQSPSTALITVQH